MRTKLTARILAMLLVGISLSSAGELTGESRAAADALEKFHGALAHGDAKAAMELLAPDAVILESGGRESREEYEKGHLSEDIEFSKAVKTTASTPTVHVEGNAAWVSSTSRTEGTFKGHDVNSVGAELVVLTNSPAGWRIRAIHWSSHRINPAN